MKDAVETSFPLQFGLSLFIPAAHLPPDGRVRQTRQQLRAEGKSGEGKGGEGSGAPRPPERRQDGAGRAPEPRFPPGGVPGPGQPGAARQQPRQTHRHLQQVRQGLINGDFIRV